VGIKKVLKRCIEGVGIFSLGYLTGSAFGRALHDSLVYLIPLYKFGNQNWFNFTQYAKIYH
jgi:hypothetical protein